MSSVYKSASQGCLMRTFNVHEAKNRSKSAWVPGGRVEVPDNRFALLVCQLLLPLLFRS